MHGGGRREEEEEGEEGRLGLGLGHLRTGDVARGFVVALSLKVAAARVAQCETNQPSSIQASIYQSIYQPTNQPTNHLTNHEDPPPPKNYSVLAARYRVQRRALWIVLLCQLVLAS